MIRYFPKILLTIALLGSLSKNASAQEIGLDLRSFQDQFTKDFPGTMAKVKDLGIKEVSLSDTYGLSFPEIIKQLAVNELSVISFEGEFEKLRDFPQAVADEARSYGAKYVVCSWIPHDTDSFTIADVDRAAEVFVQAGKVMARNGLLLCYQPHGYEFQPYNKGTVFDYITEKFDSRFIQFQMDAFWVRQAGQNPVALLKKYHSRWVLVTLKDRKPGAVTTLDGRADGASYVALGDGDVGIAEVMKEVKKYGVQHVFIDDQSGRADEHLPRSISFLKSLEE